MKGFVSLLMLGLLYSCSSTMVQDVHGTSKYAPTGYKQSGTVKYLNQGADFIIKSRRDDAFKQMYTACGGPEYEVLGESDRPDSRTISSNGFGGYSVFDQNYVYIRFKCR